MHLSIIIKCNMLIRPDVLPENLPNEARAGREAGVLGVRGKPVLAAGVGGKEGLLLHEFLVTSINQLILQK